MTFRPECVDQFCALFDRYKERIRAAEGCRHLELLREQSEGVVFFTYSHWTDPRFLDDYRNSATFAEVWPQTKALFAAPAEAWTVDTLHRLPDVP